MRNRTFILLLLLSVLSWTPASGLAQEGHPLTGSWTGDWGPSPTERSNITLVMEWEGEKIGGFVLLGATSVPIVAVAVNVADWTVRLEAKGKDAKGNAIDVAADGRLENIGSAHRTLTGTWSQGTAKGDFKITRD
ncbi:MAG TPA: hypothetical protein VM818_18410 [Vicinamibacterales bacterium]|jgi:hypothetical protein|nr:hypothetical protein [Vicinamibacterales bacterium]